MNVTPCTSDNPAFLQLSKKGSAHISVCEKYDDFAALQDYSIILNQHKEIDKMEHFKRFRIDLASSFTAINPVNRHIYNEYNAVIFYAADSRLIPALNAYKVACIELGSDSNHILSIELLIDRVKIFQTKGHDETNIIDRKFITKAKLLSNSWSFNQVNTIVFCAKDKAFPAFINEYINMELINNHPNYNSTQSLKDLLDRVIFYQENIEAKVPDTNIEGEIQRCIHGIEVDADTSKADTLRYLELCVNTVTSLGQLSRIPVSSKDDGKQDIYGTIIHVNDPLAQINGIFINSNGDNEHLDDWYRVYSYDDERFLNIVKCRYHIEKEISLDLKLIYAKTNEVVDFSIPDRQTINSKLSNVLILEVPAIHSIGDLLSLPEIENGVRYPGGFDIKLSIFGSIFRIKKGLTFINITGKNGSINDWHCIKSMDDIIFINTIRLAHNIEQSIKTIDIELRFDTDSINAVTHNEMVSSDPHNVTKSLDDEVSSDYEKFKEWVDYDDDAYNKRIHEISNDTLIRLRYEYLISLGFSVTYDDKNGVDKLINISYTIDKEMRRRCIKFDIKRLSYN